jgi:hypothetical protein
MGVYEERKNAGDDNRAVYIVIGAYGIETP